MGPLGLGTGPFRFRPGAFGLDAGLLRLDAGLLGLGSDPLGLLAAPQQFLLVGAAVGGVEDGGTDQQRLAAGAVLDHGRDQHGQPAAALPPHLQGDTAQLALHAQQRREVRLVVQPPADGEQVREAPVAHHGLALQAEPVQQRRVDLGDGAVHHRGQIAARRRLVQVLRAVLQQRGERRVHAGPVPRGVRHPAGATHHCRDSRKSRIASAVASGALSCGQCPVAASVTRWEDGIAACT